MYHNWFSNSRGKDNGYSQIDMRMTYIKTEKNLSEGEFNFEIKVIQRLIKQMPEALIKETHQKSLTQIISKRDQSQNA